MNTRDKNLSLLLIAKKAAILAGSFLSERKGSITIDSEKNHDIKISSDRESEQIIIDYLEKNSDFSILSEERGRLERIDDSFTWVIDPLDGSFNYFRGISLCCVSIGLWKQKSPVLGAIYDFNTNELFTGIAGEAAWRNNMLIKTSSVNKKSNAVLCTGFPVESDLSKKNLAAFVKKIQEYKKIRMLGSAALSLAYVASGKADAYMENDIMIWDIAAGVAIAHGAGGRFKIVDGRKPDSFNVIVSNGNFSAE
jgi:fructose-1,6-bisphosphatase/inositol monophosphatase family enzyme